MDQNLTGLISANVALSQSWYAIAAIALSGPISAAVGAYAVYKTKQWSENQEKNKADLQIRRDLFAQLLSKKKRLTQLYVSSFETKIYSNYHTCSEAIFEAQENEGKVVDSYLKEQRYWKRYWIRRGHHLQDILFAEEDEFLKLIGLVSVVFPETEGLKKLISKIDNIKTLIPPPEPILSDFKTDPISALNRLEKWKNDTTISLDAKVKKEYLQPIDDLIDFLKPYLKNDLGQDQPRRQD